jgi:hypothetical protein
MLVWGYGERPLKGTPGHGFNGSLPPTVPPQHSGMSMGPYLSRDHPTSHSSFSCLSAPAKTSQRMDKITVDWAPGWWVHTLSLKVRRTDGDSRPRSVKPDTYAGPKLRVI